MGKFIFSFIFLVSHHLFASNQYCGKLNSYSNLCVKENPSSGRYFIKWNQSILPLNSKVTSPLDGSVTYSGYINQRYPFESYTLVLKVESANENGIPAVFSYAKTYEKSEVYTFYMGKY